MRPEDVVLAVGLDDGWIVRFAALDLGGAGLAGVAGVLGVRRCVRVGVRRAAGQRADEHGGRQCGGERLA